MKQKRFFSLLIDMDFQQEYINDEKQTEKELESIALKSH